MVGLEAFGLREPEIRDLGQHLAFAWDIVGHDDVKGGDAVRGDKEQAVAEIKDFPNLSAFEFADSGHVELEQSLVSHHARSIGTAWKIPNPKSQISTYCRVPKRNRAVVLRQGPPSSGRAVVRGLTERGIWAMRTNACPLPRFRQILLGAVWM